MLSLLLDQNISPEIVEQVRSKRAEIAIISLYEWQSGAFIGMADERILQAAALEGLTLVTYDRKTIPPVIAAWGIAGQSHGGVIFVDNRTMASNDFGRLVRSLIHYWESEHESEWTNRIGFLPAPPP